MKNTIQVSIPEVVLLKRVTDILHDYARGDNHHKRTGIPYLLVFSFDLNFYIR